MIQQFFFFDHVMIVVMPLLMRKFDSNDKGVIMKFKILSGGSCGGGTCPAVYDFDEDHVIVQGWDFDGIDGLPNAESTVRIPKSILRDLKF